MLPFLPPTTPRPVFGCPAMPSEIERNRHPHLSEKSIHLTRQFQGFSDDWSGLWCLFSLKEAFGLALWRLFWAAFAHMPPLQCVCVCGVFCYYCNDNAVMYQWWLLINTILLNMSVSMCVWPSPNEMKQNDMSVSVYCDGMRNEMTNWTRQRFNNNNVKNINNVSSLSGRLRTTSRQRRAAAAAKRLA